MPSVTLDPVRARRVLLYAVVVLTALTAVARVAEELAPGSVTANALHFFDATTEQSIPTLFSTLLLSACALLLAGIAANATRQRGRWWLLAGVLAFLALDEAVGFHEASVEPLRRLLDVDGLLYFTWVVPAALFVAALVPAFRPLLRELDRPQRRFVVTGAALFFGGAIGLELVEGSMTQEHGERYAGLIPVATAQECLEMTGVVLAAYALADRLAPWQGAMRLARGG
ncbi:MAG TPA: hypothetical protein VF715_01900 [Thermoleophilaceae bacterium]